MADTGSMFPYTTHASTINRFYEEHKDNCKAARKLRDEPVAGTPAITDTEVNYRIQRANETLHEGVHQTLLQLSHMLRNSILKQEVVAAQKTLMEADPKEWQAYIYDRIGTSTQEHHMQIIPAGATTG